MSIAFIPIQTSQDLFDNQVVSQKWNQFVTGITKQINDTLHTNCKPESIQSILQETLEEHYSNKTTTKPSTKQKEIREQCVHILTNNKQCPNKAKLGTDSCPRHASTNVEKKKKTAKTILDDSEEEE
jgi:hypothetical protein